MKLMGLIGGMSWQSTSQYYDLINRLVSERLGGLSSARMVVYSLDFAEVELTQREEQWDDALALLVEAGSALKRAGADFLVLCANTRHKVADQLEQQVGLPPLNQQHEHRRRERLSHDLNASLLVTRQLQIVQSTSAPDQCNPATGNDAFL